VRLRQGDNVAENASTFNIGFLTVVQEPGGHLGGYLVTNRWGRPLEFRLSTAVQPNKVQQILYGASLNGYVCADLIGKTLFDKTGTPVSLIVTDRAAVLELRQTVAIPVICLAGPESDAVQGTEVLPGKANLLHHLRFPEDGPAVRTMLQQLDEGIDLGEPFGRIREAIGEARKMGVTGKN